MKISKPIAQVSFFLLFFFVPLLNIFRVDLVQLRFYILGKSFTFSDGYILLLSVLLIVFLFVGISKWFGRQFCGWMCPHNTFSVHLNKLTRTNLFKNHPVLEKCANFGLPALFAPIIGYSMLAYFIDPFILFKQIISFQWNSWSFGAFLLLSIFFFIMIFRLRSRFCRHACPYGMFQMTFADKQSKARGVKNMFQGAGLVLLLIVGSLISLLGFSLFSTSGYAAIIEKQIQGAPTGEFLTYTYRLKVQNNHPEDLQCEIEYKGIPDTWEALLPDQIKVGGDFSHEETLLFRVDPSSLNQRHDIVVTLTNIQNGAIIEKELIIYPVH